MSNAPGANPYAIPATAIVDASLAAGSDAETIRKKFLSHEASVKSVGLLYWLGSIFVLIAAGMYLFMGIALLSEQEAAAGITMLIAAPIALVIAVLQMFLAVGIRKLKPWARICAIVLSAIGLIGFPIGTLISAYILYLMVSKKGIYVFSDEYKQVIAATPHLKYKTSLIVWVLVGVLAVFVVSAIVAVTVSGSR